MERKHIFSVIFLLLLSNLFGYTFAQPDLLFKTLSTATGLSQSSVNCIIQDKEGQLWFGTQDGLNLYNGHSFKVYQHEPTNPSSIPDNYILCMAEDMDGIIWIGTMSGGIIRFDKRREVFTSIPLKDAGRKVTSLTSIWTVVCDSNSQVWFGTSNGIAVINRKTLSIKRYFHNQDDVNSIPADNVLCLNKLKNGNIAVGTNNGLAILIKDKGIFNRLIDKNDTLFTTDERIIWSVTEDSYGNIVAGTNNRVLYFDKRSKGVERIPSVDYSNKLTTWSVYCDQNTIIWFGTQAGLCRYSNSAKQFRIYSHSAENPNSLPEDNVWCIMKDYSNNLWMGTNGGVALTKTEGQVFTIFGEKSAHNPVLSNSRVNAILEDDSGTLWIGTEGGGLNRLDPGAESFTIYKNKKNRNSVPGDYIWSLVEDISGNIWIGTYGTGLSKLDKKTGLFTNYFYDQKIVRTVSNNRILALFEDSEGMIWAGTRGGGLNMYDPVHDKFTIYTNDPDDPESISSTTVLSIAEDKNGILWIGTFDGGLNRFDKRTGKFKVYKNIPGDNTSLSNNNVWAVVCSKNNRIWLATQGGLNVTSTHSGKLVFNYFDKADGLPSNTIFGLVEDDQGNIWISSFNGITRLNIDAFESIGSSTGEQKNHFPFTALFQNFSKEDGLPGNEFNQGAYTKGKSGNIYFGGLNGMLAFHPNSLRSSNHKPRIVFTGFKIFNHEVGILDTNEDKYSSKVVKKGNQYFLPCRITFMNNLVLTYREKFFSFDFATLDYFSPQNIEYAYMLEGFDKEWNFTGHDHTVSFTNISPGKYALLVISTNESGVWNMDPLKLNIIILPPFWKTPLFIVMFLFVTIALSAFLIYRTIRNVKIKAAKEREKVELQLKTLKNQIDPHFVFNAINQIGSFIYSGTPDVVYDYFSRFARLMRTTLKDSEKISRELKEEIDFVKDYLVLQQARFKNKFSVEWSLEEGIDMNTEVPKMILQVHVENAIKHGLMHKTGEGKLWILLRNEPEAIVVTIKDNGVGREMAASLGSDGTGRGMQIIDEINTLYNSLYEKSIRQEISDLKDKEGNASGTRVMIYLYRQNI